MALMIFKCPLIRTKKISESNDSTKTIISDTDSDSGYHECSSVASNIETKIKLVTEKKQPSNIADPKISPNDSLCDPEDGYLEDYPVNFSKPENRAKNNKFYNSTKQVWNRIGSEIVFQLLRRDKIEEIHGMVATGKEANIYKAVSESGNVAIKFFRSSVSGSKNRNKYITGDCRYMKSYNGRNKSKMVKLWAQKEYRNLTRMYRNGISVPQPLYVKSNVLLMEFIGNNETVAPTLRDTNLAQSIYCRIYINVLILMWEIYNRAKLVHTDLSEYNILYWKDQVFVIDVSQAVERTHPDALQFLRRDCENIVNYFSKQNVPIGSVDSLIKFITDDALMYNDMMEKFAHSAEESMKILFDINNYQSLESEEEENEDE